MGSLPTALRLPVRPDSKTLGKVVSRAAFDSLHQFTGGVEGRRVLLALFHRVGNLMRPPIITYSVIAAPFGHSNLAVAV